MVTQPGPHVFRARDSCIVISLFSSLTLSLLSSCGDADADVERSQTEVEAQGSRIHAFLVETPEAARSACPAVKQNSPPFGRWAGWVKLLRSGNLAADGFVMLENLLFALCPFCKNREGDYAGLANESERRVVLKAEVIP